jgi:hypothetical protein
MRVKCKQRTQKVYKIYSYLFIMETIRDGLSPEKISTLIKRYRDAGYKVVDNIETHGVAHLYMGSSGPLACISVSAVYLISERCSNEIREIAESI